ncbi:protein-tyrosine phosphatase family protein [Tabrizicola sp.]|uniref:phosphatase domain-containing putative toxin n=1 Tax=Tabrizicola sp. TaxID=2005166 RepID=UPI003D29B968
MQVAEIEVPGGALGLCPMPGRTGDYAGDLAAVLAWRPGLVVTLAETGELAARGAAGLPADLAAAGVDWLHLPIPDFGTPPAALRRDWPAMSARLRASPRVLVHCMGGCGRSGMIALRLMIEAGEPPEPALTRLRAARPCAVETKAQMRWAMGLEMPDHQPQT